MRFYVAVLVAAVAGVAPLLLGRGDVVDVAVEESPDAPPLGPPPVLAGAAHPQETGVVALASEADEIEPYAVRPPLPKMRLIAMDWTLRVVDESGYCFDPMGLISVVISSPDVTKFRSSITQDEIVISEVTERDTVRIVRDFPAGVEIAGLPLEDTVEVRPASKRVRVVLRGWTPARIVVPEPDRQEASSGSDYFEVVYADGCDRSRLQARGLHAIPVRSRREFLSAIWWRESGTGDGKSRLQVLHGTIVANQFTTD